MVSLANRWALVRDAISDILGGLKRWRLWSALALEDVRRTYKRSLIGVLWISISFAMFVAVKVFIFSAMQTDIEVNEFSAYVTIGFFVWQFLSQTVALSQHIFAEAENWLRNDPIEPSVFVFENIARSLIDLSLTGAIVIIACILWKINISIYVLLLIPCLVVFVINAVWVYMLIGCLCTRYRDLSHLITAVMRLMFFLTPIFWYPEQFSQEVQNILFWNPFAHFLYIVRNPILFQDPALESWVFIGVLTVTGWVSALFVYSIARKRLVFWF